MKQSFPMSINPIKNFKVRLRFGVWPKLTNLVKLEEPVSLRLIIQFPMSQEAKHTHHYLRDNIIVNRNKILHKN